MDSNTDIGSDVNLGVLPITDSNQPIIQGNVLSLASALSQGLVDAEFFSTGNYYGPVVIANIYNKSNKNLVLDINLWETLAFSCPSRPTCSKRGEIKRDEKNPTINDPMDYVWPIGIAKENYLYELCLTTNGKDNNISGKNIKKDFFDLNGLPKNKTQLPFDFDAGEATYNQTTNCFEYNSNNLQIAPAIALNSNKEYGFISNEDFEKICKTNIKTNIKTCFKFDEKQGGFYNSSYFLEETTIFLYELKQKKDCYTQDLVISSVSKIDLNSNGFSQITINGFCIEANDDGPKLDMVYDLCPQINDQVLSLLEKIKQKNVLLEEGAQYAIWRITDDPTLESFKPKLSDYGEYPEGYAQAMADFNAKFNLSEELLKNIN